MPIKFKAWLSLCKSYCWCWLKSLTNIIIDREVLETYNFLFIRKKNGTFPRIMNSSPYDVPIEIKKHTQQQKTVLNYPSHVYVEVQSMKTTNHIIINHSAGSYTL